MTKLMPLASLLVAGLLVSPAAAGEFGVEGATVTLVCTNAVICAAPGVVVPPPVTTDAKGAFSFDGLAAAPWQLQVLVKDAVTMAPVKTAQLDFAVAADKAPARLAGRVSVAKCADLSLQINAKITAPGPAGIVLDPGYPKLQPEWNLNWSHSNGQLHVRLAGSGLDALEKVALTSAAGSIEATQIFKDTEEGEYHAVFPKWGAFKALVPTGAVRGDLIPVAVALTTATGTQTYEVKIHIVGPQKPQKPKKPHKR